MNLMDLFIKVGVKDEASAPIKKLTGAVGNGLKTAAKVGVAAVGALYTGAAALSTAFVKGAAELANYGDNIDKMSQKMGMSAQAYQEWDAILQHSGTSIDSMQRGMMTLSKAAEDGSDAFAKIGLTQEEVASMSQEELFAATIKGLQGMEEGSERAVLAQKLLGTAAKELGPLLNTSAEETEEMRQKLHKLGGVMSDEDVKAAAKFTDSLQDMKTAFNGLKISAMRNFLPAITTVMDGVQELLTGDSGVGIEMISEGIEKTTEQISSVLPEIVELATSILGILGKAMIELLPRVITSLFKTVWTSVDNAISQSSFGERWTSIKEAVASAVDGIKGKWDELVTAAQPLIDAIKKLWDKFTEWEEENHILEGAIGLVGDAIEDVIQFITDLTNLGTGVWDMIAGAAEGSAERVDNAWSKVRDTFADIARILVGSGIANSPAAGVVLSGGGGGLSGLFGGGKKFAIGNDYVPYDNYPALLHRGEAILTAREADAWRRGTTGGQIVNNFTFNGVSQSDLDYIVGYVNREMVSG